MTLPIANLDSTKYFPGSYCWSILLAWAEFTAAILPISQEEIVTLCAIDSATV